MNRAGPVRILQRACVCFSDRFVPPADINKLCCLFVSAPFLSWKEFLKDIKRDKRQWNKEGNSTSSDQHLKSLLQRAIDKIISEMFYNFTFSPQNYFYSFYFPSL